MRQLLEDAAQRAIVYLENLAERSVVPSPEAIQNLKSLDEPLPEGSMPAEAVLCQLDEVCSPATMAMAGPRFFGFVTGGALPATLAANWLAGAWDQNSPLYNVTPATAHLEKVSLGWLLELFNLPVACGGSFVTGASVANFTALAAARHAVLRQAGWNVEADGLFGAPPITVVVGEEAHPTLFKSLGLLGLGRSRVTRVPVDGQGQMRADKLPEIAGPTIVCAQTGNVNTGAFDPLVDICAHAHAAGAWVHVDGAFGMWAAAVPEMAHLTAGLADADSWATDFHKWLNVPYDSGLALSRDVDALRAAMAITAEYLPTDSPVRNPSDFTPEFSRRGRGVEVWAALRSIGAEGVRDMIRQACRHAQRFADGLDAAGYEVLNEVVLNQVLVAFGDAGETARTIAAIQADGTCWAGPTVWQGHVAMRISVSSWATKEEDVERSLASIVRIARQICR